jgi:hypothetical protein
MKALSLWHSADDAEATERRRRTLSTALMVLAVVAYVVVPIGPAQASHCSGDTWADVGNGAGNGVIHWQDNYWVGDGCDKNGEYTLGIQRINWGQGFTQSATDGYFGPNTKADVEDYQDQEGETVDGLVGSDTWDAYENAVSFDSQTGTWKYYVAEGTGGSKDFMRHTGLSPDRWYGRKSGTSATWVQFGTSGPAS